MDTSPTGTSITKERHASEWVPPGQSFGKQY